VQETTWSVWDRWLVGDAERDPLPPRDRL